MLAKVCDELWSYLHIFKSYASTVQKKSRDYTDDAFTLTTQVLNLNPEFYTIWNYRRDILVQATFKKWYFKLVF